MAFGRLERGATAQPIADINMTPLIDVMLVLLVIFIVTAPLMASSLQLELPKADGAAASADPGFVSIALDATGATYLDDRPAAADALEAAVRAAAARDPATEVRLRADRAVPYGRVAELIALVQRGGLSRIGFVTEAGGPR